MQLRRRGLYYVLASYAVGVYFAWPHMLTAASVGQETPHAITARLCSGCHSLQVVMDTPRDYDAWHDTVQNMIDRGARGTSDEFAQVMQYLFETVTTVDVNHGDEEELVTVLHTTAETAGTIIERRAKRRFKDLADLEAAVPALDRQLLEAKRKMILFQ
jgi:hypothetical protein